MEAKLNILLLGDAALGDGPIFEQLAAAGFRSQARRADSAADLRHILKESPPDLILADFSRPELDALTALGILRAEKSTVPLIVLTSPQSEEMAIQCLRAGAADYLLTSRLAELPAAVRRVRDEWWAAQRRTDEEAALRWSEAQFRLMTENSRDLVCLLDLDAEFLYASPSFSTILGRPVSELLGTRCSDLIHPEEARAFREALDEALFFHEGRNAELRFRHANGSWLAFESAISIIFDEQGRPQRALVASRDTSDRKRAEKEIRKLAAFPRFNPNPVLEFAADGALTYFNDAALEMARSLKKNHPQSILPLNAATTVKLCLSTGQSKLHHEVNVGGRVLSWSFFPVLSHHLVHCYAEDVTERMNLEAQLRQAQKMDSIGQLAAGVAHDFNNILTIIQGHAGLLNADPAISGRNGESSRQIAMAAERAANLTRQLLLFSRKQILQPQLLNLDQVIHDLSKMLRALIGEQVTLKAQHCDDIAWIHADPGMMEQILVNLSVNARDAMPRGGTITIDTRPVEIDPSYVQRHPEARVGQFICLSVCDTGHGMDDETLAHMFEPFFTTKEIGKGTGLGLATVYGIVTQHHGWIDVESRVGQGTTFRVYLPQATKAPARTSSTRPAQVPGGDETILVVEDETALRELVQEILEQKGYRVLEAASGVQALEIWNRHKDDIDLLLTDMMMPEGMSGQDLAERVLQDRVDMKVIYTSGYSLDVVDLQANLQDGSNFLQKPYDAETLALTVRTCLNR